jgi:hypothetical protein
MKHDATLVYWTTTPKNARLGSDLLLRNLSKVTGHEFQTGGG